MLKEFRQYLLESEKSPLTIEKYTRDVSRFLIYAKERELSKQLVLEYKAYLAETYAITSVNSMLAALNVFLDFTGHKEFTVKRFTVQRNAYCSEEKELTRAEYERLIRAASAKGDERLMLMMQTICATGIRVSELQHITIEAVNRGEAQIICKGKVRKIFIIKKLQKKLKTYAGKRGIKTGPVFITRKGKPIDRSNIWRQMKKLCSSAGVAASKIFPHNLRHLFARIFYEIEKDIVKLADVLGHTSIDTTRIYTITTGHQHRQKLECMKLII